MAKQTVHICWFRRDLRLHDNAALYHALKEGIPVVPVFIFDRSILDKLEDKQDRRVEFIHLAIAAIPDNNNFPYLSNANAAPMLDKKR
mgnify:CR=1 FL=1